MYSFYLLQSTIQNSLMVAFTYKCWISIFGHESLLLQGHQTSVTVHNVFGFVIVQKWPLRKPSELKGAMHYFRLSEGAGRELKSSCWMMGLARKVFLTNWGSHRCYTCTSTRARDAHTHRYQFDTLKFVTSWYESYHDVTNQSSSYKRYWREAGGGHFIELNSDVICSTMAARVAALI